MGAYGGINVLVNNAAILHPGTVEQVTEQQWDETFNLNVRGLWLFSRAVLPHMRQARGGSIVNLASVLGIHGARLRAVYSASKQVADPEAVRRERIQVHPTGRLGQPEDAGGLAVYLASDESSWVAGARVSRG